MGRSSRCSGRKRATANPSGKSILADAEAKITLRAWSDSPGFPACDKLAAGAFLEVTGEFAHNGAYGVDAKRWTCRELTPPEREVLLGGSPALREKQAADFRCIAESVEAIADPRLLRLSRMFLDEFGPRFRRAAAARGNHHARRGGLVEHVAQMIRSGAGAGLGLYGAQSRPSDRRRAFSRQRKALGKFDAGGWLRHAL